ARTGRPLEQPLVQLRRDELESELREARRELEVEEEGQRVRLLAGGAARAREAQRCAASVFGTLAELRQQRVSQRVEDGPVPVEARDGDAAEAIEEGP